MLTKEGPSEFIFSFSRLLLQLPLAFGSGEGERRGSDRTRGKDATPAAGGFPRGAVAVAAGTRGGDGGERAAERGRPPAERYLGASE